jgi:hypothetical protein
MAQSLPPIDLLPAGSRIDLAPCVVTPTQYGNETWCKPSYDSISFSLNWSVALDGALSGTSPLLYGVASNGATEYIATCLLIYYCPQIWQSNWSWSGWSSASTQVSFGNSHLGLSGGGNTIPQGGWTLFIVNRGPTDCNVTVDQTVILLPVS